ncbi:MAG: hypothetical protein AAF211_20635, partial [Myxococcota bacterium]
DDGTELADLAELEGTWVRVESNNPANDFMKVEVVGDAGTIVDASSSSFSENEVKWQAITPSGPASFSYLELGSDRGRYDATLTIVSEDELEIAVGNSGAGNTQKWWRDDGTIVDTSAQVLDCSIDTDTVLRAGPAPVDYIASCVVDVTAMLTIEPGVVIEFESDAGLGVYDNGFLNAEGTAEAPIVFRGLRDERGFWRGVHTEADTVLEHVSVENAGSNYVYCCNEAAAVFAKDGRLSMESTTIRDSGALGLALRNGVTLTRYGQNTITGSVDAPVRADFELAGNFDGLGSDYTGNDVDFIELATTRVDRATTLPPANVPYRVEDGVVDVTDALRIEAGVEIHMQADAGIGVFDGGSLDLAGSAGQPVVIRGAQAVRGFWRGIHVETNSLSNRFSYAEIAHTGSDYVYCCNDIAAVYLKGGRLSISDSILSEGSSYGVYANADAQLQFDRNTIRTHSEAPLYLAAERAGELDGLGSTYENNGENYVRIFNSDVSQTTFWPRNAVPYLIGQFVVDVTEGLSIEPGAEVVFEENAGIGVYNNGSLNAVGSASAPIVFRGRQDVPGFWRGIHTETTSVLNEISHGTIQNAGSNYVYCCNVSAGLLVRRGTMNLNQSTIADNDGCGVSVNSSATLTESGNTFANNEDGNICN